MGPSSDMAPSSGVGPASPIGVWNIYFLPGLNVSACNVVVPGGLCGQTVRVDTTGAFHETWTAGAPLAFVQADGTLTAAALTATLKCVSTGAPGTMSATPSGAEYAGTATLSTMTVSIRVVQGGSPCPP
jgi:hypothetical protein